MGFTIDDALLQTQEQYKLQLLAGENGCGNAISWVHLIEDTTIIRQLWGKELVITTGLGFQEEGSLLKLVHSLVKYHSGGLIINVGKYIVDIPDDVIDYCNEQDLPLITIPWEIHLADVIKDYCMRCLYSEREDIHVSECFINAFSNPMFIEEGRMDLMSTFDVDGDFQVLLISIDDSNLSDPIERRRITFQLQLYFERIECTYSCFWYNEFFVLVVNNLNQDYFMEIVQKMYNRSKKRMNYNHIYIGVGSPVKDFRNITVSYKRALAATRYAVLFNNDIVYFKDMGVYQILLSVEDKDILYDSYYQLLKPIINYDKKHNGELEKTLFYYFKYNGSLLMIADEMYTHRNTVHYRIEKIKNLLNCDFETMEEKFPYMMAFYIKDIVAHDNH